LFLFEVYRVSEVGLLPECPANLIERRDLLGAFALCRLGLVAFF